MTRRAPFPLSRAPLAGALLLAMVAARPAAAVVLDDENRITVSLKDGTKVALIGEATSTAGKKSRNYYYLPTNLRLAARPDGTPEFLFLKFTSEKRAEQGGPSGALLHFLMLWGLTPEQLTELTAKVKAQFPSGAVLGQVPLETPSDASSFHIVSATLSDSGLTKAVVDSGRAPIVEDARAAAASRLTPEGAALLAASFEKAKSITDLSVALTYSYTTLMPAARGRVIVDWSKLERSTESLVAEYSARQTGVTHKKACILSFCASSSTPEYSYSYDEARSQFDFLVEKQVVTLEFDELVADERVAKIRDAFFQFFLNSMARPAEPQGATPEPGQAEKDRSPEIKMGRSYKFSQTAIKQAAAQRTQRFELNYRTTVKWPVQLVGNLASWYDGVRDNPKCVATVNVGDPFFEHRDINFILDLDAKDIFDQVVNYVTVNVRKPRSTGRAFEDRVTFDAPYVQKHGIVSTVTYARGEDTSPDLYEYRAQWSLRGGQLWPRDPAWTQGTWEGVTLSPPIVPRVIEAEADLDQLRASDIVRATVQIRYAKFGEESEENIQISPTRNEPIASKRIFLDRGARGYAYRLVLNHRTQGKFALPWSAQVGDDYVFVTVPPELLQDGPLRTSAREAARALEAGVKENVLDRFQGVLGGDS